MNVSKTGRCRQCSPISEAAYLWVPFDRSPTQGSTIYFKGGSVSGDIAALDGSVVNVSGGSAGAHFGARGGSVVNISGGSVGDFSRAYDGSLVNISGGSVGESFRAEEGSIVNISGGSITEGFIALGGSTVNLFGTEFVLDNIDITSSLTANVPFTIGDRNVGLSGLLADGSAFRFDLNSTYASHRDYFHADAILTVTFLLPGDYNDDGRVDALDYTVWRDHLGSEVTLPGDTTPGTVTQTDYALWKANFGSATHPTASSVGAVPEPTSLLLLLVALGFGWPASLRGRRSLRVPSHASAMPPAGDQDPGADTPES